MQSDLRQRADFCFCELLDETRHEIPFVGHTHVPRRPYTSRKDSLRSFVRYGRYGKDFYRHPFRQFLLSRTFVAVRRLPIGY
jgi:hypothetical protein